MYVFGRMFHSTFIHAALVVAYGWLELGLVLFIHITVISQSVKSYVNVKCLDWQMFKACGAF